MRIAILGGGVMGETLATGLLRRDPRPDVVIAEKRAERAAELVDGLGVTVADPVDAVAEADVVVLVVKPQDTMALLAEIGSAIPAGALVISIAAGIRTSSIESAVTPGANVVRAMPNTPARIDQGVTGVSGGAGCSADALALAEDLMSSVGLVVTVPEDLQDAVTAVSGSGPAYLFYLAEAMTAAGVDLGLSEDDAVRMVNQTLLGAAMLLSTSGESAADLRRKVTSPGGTTAAAIGTMEARDVGAGVQAALAAARDRSRELSGS